MAAYFNQKTKKWDANFSYKDYENNSKKKMKRGFQTKEEAEVWETEYKELCKKDMSKTFGEFYKNYESDIRSRVKESTWRVKGNCNLQRGFRDTKQFTHGRFCDIMRINYRRFRDWSA